MVVSSAVWLTPPSIMLTDFSPQAQVAFEQNGYGVASLPRGTRLPSTLAAGLAPERNLLESYRDPLLARISPGTPARVTPISSGSHASAWQVSVTAPTRITLSLAYYPGWEATLDGESLTVERDPASGLTRVLLPQVTTGTLRVAMGTTLERTLSWIVFAGTLLVLLLWARYSREVEPANVLLLNLQELRLTTFALTFAGLAIVASAAPGAAFNLRVEPLSSLRGSQQVTADSDPLRLLAYRLDTHVTAGGSFAFTLYWTATATPSANYRVRVGLVDINTQQRTSLTALTAPGDLPTRRWVRGYAVIDAYRVSLPADLPRGTYQVSVEAFPCAETCDLTAPLRFRDSQGIERVGVLLPSVVTVE
jgi:hypothetical protein